MTLSDICPWENSTVSMKEWEWKKQILSCYDYENSSDFTVPLKMSWRLLGVHK